MPQREGVIQTHAETSQETVWQGDFGRAYTDRNTLDPESLDELSLRNYGIARSTIVRRFLEEEVPKDASILEIGCNSGNQLLLLSKMGWSNLSGLELQPHAIEIARSRLPGAVFRQGSAFALPWQDRSFDLVFTSGVLIHVSPQDLPRVLNEIYRTTRNYIWCSEYYAPEATEVRYRDHGELLWKMDYARCYLERFPDLEMIKEERLPYLKSQNTDIVFLLKKTSRD